MEISKPNRSKYKEVKERSLAVSRKGFEREYGRVVFFPEIRLKGKWLEDYGFAMGDRVTVIVKKGRILMRK